MMEVILDSKDSSGPVEYARRLYEDVLRWYHNADTKAQVLLTLSGVFVTFLTGSIFSTREDLSALLSGFSQATWVFLAAMSLTISGSILSALACLYSRTYRPAELKKFLLEKHVQREKWQTYTPEILWFFQVVNQLDPVQFGQRLDHLSEADELKVMAFQISQLSRNVTRKHFWVNIGFGLIGLSLALFLCSGISYVVHVISS
jgi:hypothetical protein